MKTSSDAAATLKKNLKVLDTYQKNVKIRLALNKPFRNLKYLKEFFGQTAEPGDEHKEINLTTDIDNFVNKLKEKLYQHDNTQHTERTGRTNPEQNGTDSTIQSESPGHTTDSQEVSKAIKTMGSGEGGLRETSHIETGLQVESIFNPKFPDQIATLTTQHSHGCEQVANARRIFDNIWYKKMRGQQLIALAGSGKTFILGSILKNLVENNFHKDCYSPWPYLYITRAPIILQTESVLRDLFNLDTTNTVIVINYEALRSSLIGTLIEEETIIEQGEPKIIYRWRNGYQPVCIINDESQSLARPDSLQSRISNALFDSETTAPYETYQIDASATPGSRISEFKHFALASKKRVPIAGIGELAITKETWSRIATQIASPSLPEDHCTAAITRFMDVMEDNITRVKNIRPKFKGYVTVTPIEFDSPALADEYFKAVELHEKKSKRISEDETLSEGQRALALIAEFTIFRKAAENCRRHYLAQFMQEQWEKGFAPTLACGFKQTITNVVGILIDEYKWKRDDISLIWGGSTEALSNKRKLAKKIKNSEKLQDLLEELDIDTEEDLGIYLEEVTEKTEEQLAFERKYNLLSQKPKEREKERLRFQRQNSRGCIFSYKSGGVGISLHHEEFYTKARPRRGKLTPVYSEKELVQAIYRTPRLTSISDTYQDMPYFCDTIEEHVKGKIVQKLKCLKEVIRATECWEGMIVQKMVGLTLKQYEKHTDAVDEALGEMSDGSAEAGIFNEFVEK